LECLTANAKVATVLGAIPASTDTDEAILSKRPRNHPKKEEGEARKGLPEDPQIIIIYVSKSVLQLM
jgi:hypothetical protein